MKNSTPFQPGLFHSGELEIQQLTGEQDTAAKMAGLIQSRILPAALDFIRQQAVIWIGVRDSNKNHWAFPLFGSPGFIRPDDEGTLLEIRLDQTSVIPGQWSSQLVKDNAIGCLVIELASRRRIRINGVINAINKHCLKILVQQYFPNCPKYIRKRSLAGSPELAKLALVAHGSALTKELENIIALSDTAFVTSSGANGIDISHRGGETGFIKTLSASTLVMPDYKGNSMFSTLGNFKINPTGGLMVIDFHRAHYLQLSGTVALFFNNQHPTLNSGGTNRCWELTIQQWQLFKLANTITWQSYDFSPYNP